MASIKKLPSGSFQLSVKNRLLPKTLWVTFDSFEQADAYGNQSTTVLPMQTSFSDLEYAAEKKLTRRDRFLP